MIVIFQFIIYCLNSFKISITCPKMNVVSDIAGVLHFPSTITQPRLKRDKIVIIFAILINIVIFFCNSKNENFFLEVFFCLSFWMIFFFVAQLIKRIALCWEEKFHLQSRYNMNIHDLLISVFSLSTATITVVVLSFFYLLVALFTKPDHFYDAIQGFGIAKLLTSLMAVYLFKDFMQLDQSQLQISRKIREMEGLDYGSGMAYSFFSGYLQIILPETGDERLNIRRNLINYEDRQGIDIAVHKLFILIPTSLYCPPEFPNGPGIEIEPCNPLQPIIISRAGVRDRVYKNSVYKIYDNRMDGAKNRLFYYVCMEYATPSKTLYDVVNHNSPHANIFKKHVKELQTQFYLTLRNVIRSSRECSDLCELIYYNDVDEHGVALNNVGEVVINRIQEIMAT